MATSRELELAERAARIGGAVVERYFRGGVTMRSKDPGNLVSDADVEAERAIVAEIRRVFPTHAIIGEEGSYADAADAEHLWVIDPLDGTNNFAHQIPQFAVSVAYCRGGRPQAAALLNPIREELFMAERGFGATLNGQAIHVSAHDRLDQTLIGFGLYYEKGALLDATLDAVADLTRMNVHGVRRFGAAALDLAMVAQGQLGGFFEFTLSPWDFAGGQLIVEEAGGRVTNCDGAPLPLARTHILATNGHLHDSILKVVAARLPR
jgi:myo-inositol-1(or 4)-monophosphatase